MLLLNRLKLLMALKFDCLDLMKTQLGHDSASSRWEFAPRLTARLTNQNGSIELDPNAEWKTDVRRVTDLQSMGDTFQVLKQLLKLHDQVGASSGSASGGGGVGSQVSFWTRETYDEADMGTGFTHDPLIEKGIPRYNLQHQIHLKN